MAAQPPPPPSTSLSSSPSPHFACLLELRVLMASDEHATLAAVALGVDEELQKERARKELRAEGRELVARLSAADARLLRITASSFIDMAATLLRTMRDFA